MGALGADDYVRFVAPYSRALIERVRSTGVPTIHFGTGAAYAYRTDVFKQAGVGAPKTWDEFIKIGAAIKKAGMPVGQALGHSFGDPPGFCTALLWAFGGNILRDSFQAFALLNKTCTIIIG